MKVKVGDKVKAITNYYGMTNVSNEWEGRVLSIEGEFFTAVTTSSIEQDDIGIEFDGLKLKHFELIKTPTEQESTEL